MTDTTLIFNLIARDKTGDTFNKVKGAALVAGLAIGAALAGGVTQMLEKSNLDALTAAQLGATPQMAADIGQMSGNLYANNFGDSMAQVSAAVKDVWQNALLPEDAGKEAIEKVTGQVLTVSKVLSEETSKVSSTVAQMMRTGMAGSAEEAMDILTRATQQGINKSGDLLDTLNEYPTQFRKLGLDGVNAMGLVGQAMKAGARDSDIAADALKEFSIRAIDGSKLTAEGFKAVGLDATKMAADIAAGGPRAASALDLTLDSLRAIEDPVKRDAAAVALFGTQAEDLGAALFAMDLTTAADSMGNVAGATNAAVETMGASPGAKVEAFRRKLEMALVTKMGEAVPVIESVVGWMVKHREILEPIAVALGTLAAIIATVVVVTKIYTAVQAALNIVMMANPLGIIILLIVALVAGLIYAYTHSETFRNIVQAVWNAIKVAISATVDWLVNTAWPAIVRVWDAIVASVMFVKNIHDTVMRAIISAVMSVINWFTGTFIPANKRVWAAVTGTVTEMKNNVVNIWNTIVGFVAGLPGRISSIASGMWNGLWDGFRGVVNRIIGGWNRLSFTLPAVNIPGIGRVGGATIGTPDLPYLDVGGVIARTGIAVVHRGEHVIPAAQAAARGSGGGIVRVIIDVRGADSELKRMIRNMVKVDGRGSVQVAFGRG